VIAISMFLTPALFIFFDKVLLPRFSTSQEQREADNIDHKGRVLIAGIGRFGQIVNRLLVANGFETIVLDYDAKQVDNLRKLDTRAYFGDATRPDLLQTAGVDSVDMVVIAIDDRERVIELARYLKHRHPSVVILARAFDQIDYYRLKQEGVEHVIKETYFSALELGCRALLRLGIGKVHAEKLKNAFIQVENETVEEMYQSWVESDDSGMSPGYRELYMQQEAVIRDTMEHHRKDENEE